MRNPHTLKAAKNSVYKRKLGRQWIVVSWDEERNIWRESHTMDYWQALDTVRQHKNAVLSGDVPGFVK